MKPILFIISFSLLMSSNLFSQSLEENLQQVGPIYGKLYLQPLVNAMGANVNSNYFYTSYVPFDSKKPVQFNIGVRLRLMNTFLTSEDQAFDYSYNDTGIVNGLPVVGTYSVVNAPTVIGNKTPAIAKFTYNGVYYPSNDIEVIGGVVNTKNVPMALPEITIGTVYGTDATLILLPTINVEDFGKIRMFGITVRHNLSHYFKKSPLDFAIMSGYQRMSVTEKDNNELWKSNDFFVNGQVSKTFGVFTGYAALQYEHFSTDVSYNYISNGSKIPIKIDMEGENKFRGVLGGTVRAGFFAINLDMNIGSQFALSSGLNFIIY